MKWLIILLLVAFGCSQDAELEITERHQDACVQWCHHYGGALYVFLTGEYNRHIECVCKGNSYGPEELNMGDSFETLENPT